MKNIKEFKRSSNGLLIPNQDIVFQALFGTKGSEKFLGGFLSSILGEKVDNISLDANQNLTREEVEEKLGIVDLKANVGNQSTVHIEVQMTDPHNMFKRLLWYWARIYGIQLKNNEELRRHADLMLMAILDENSKREAREEQEKRIRKSQDELQKGQDELQKSQDELQKSQDELQKSKEEFARSLLKMNLDISEIAQITKLSIEQIQKLSSS